LPYVLVDTCVLTKMGGEYRTTLDCLSITEDIIAVTKEILKEYEGRAYPSRLILQAFLQDLEGKGKLKHFNRSRIKASLRRHENHRTINYPSHPPDRKWIEVAIAISAKYIISINEHLLRIPPNRYDNETLEVVDPSEYVVLRCPEINTC